MLVVQFDEPSLLVFKSVLEAEREIEPIDAESEIRAAFDESGIPYGVRWVRPNRRGLAQGVEFIDQGEYRLVPTGLPQPTALIELIEAHAAQMDADAHSDLPVMLTRLRSLPGSWDGQEECLASASGSELLTPEGSVLADGQASSAHGTGGVRLGGAPDRSVVTLALYSPELEPDEVTRRIGLRPTESHRKGDTFGRRKIPYRIGSWMLTAERLAPASVQECIEELLEQLPVSEELWSELSAEYEVQLRVSVFFDAVNRGFDINASVLSAVAAFRGSLVLDIYAW
jgi:hypothetical protein